MLKLEGLVTVGAADCVLPCAQHPSASARWAHVAGYCGHILYCETMGDAAGTRASSTVIRISHRWRSHLSEITPGAARRWRIGRAGGRRGADRVHHLLQRLGWPPGAAQPVGSATRTDNARTDLRPGWAGSRVVLGHHRRSITTTGRRASGRGAGPVRRSPRDAGSRAMGWCSVPPAHAGQSHASPHVRPGRAGRHRVSDWGVL